MALFFDEDIDVLRKKSEDIKTRWKKKQLETSEPKVDDVYKAHNILLNFCKEKKRKLYGGFAINVLVSSKDVAKRLYDPDQMPPPDVDIYTPEPIEDMYYIVNLLFKEGFENVRGEEALHGETYKIFYYKINLCDFSYVARNVYNRIPFINVNGLYVTHPNFMTIDYLRMLNNPVNSYWRLFDESDFKALKRLMILQKEYPLPVVKAGLKFPQTRNSSNNKQVYDIIFNFLLNRMSTVTVGFYAYNYFANEAGKDTIDLSFYEFISTDYKSDTKELISKLKEFSEKITFKEFYPFFQFTDYSVQIYLENQLICIIYDHNKKCIPYQDLKAYDFNKNKQLATDIIRLGTFTMTLMYTLINAQRERSKENNELEKFYYHMASNLIQMKNDFLIKKKQDFLDDHVFKHLVIDCIGEEWSNEKEQREKVKKRRAKSMPIILRYTPDDNFKEGPSNKFFFMNTSGNEINNPKNLRINNGRKSEDIDIDDEEEEIIEDLKEKDEK
jgi:hypothetical protein